MSGLEIDTRWDETVCTLELSGEARLENSEQFESAVGAVLSDGAKDVLVGLGGLAFMDSASAGLLLRFRMQVAERGGKLVLYSVPKIIQRLIEHAGLGGQLPAAEDEAAARAAL